MEAIKKQASKLREQVARQQQAVLKHLGHFSNDGVIVDEAEFQSYQHLQNLYNSTRETKHYQKHIVRGIEAFTSITSKQTEISRKFSQDCCNYGVHNPSTNPHFSRAALQFGSSRNLMENEGETFLSILHDQVSKPLRALITGAPLEDARHLTHRYDKLRQEVEAQAAEVLRRRSKTRDSDISAESCMRLRGAEARLSELKSTMAALGMEAIDAMLSVENQQQQITVKGLSVMVDAERCYHQHVLTILDKLHSEMILEEQLNQSSSELVTTLKDASVTPTSEDHMPSSLDDQMHANQKNACFLAKVIHPFDAQSQGELSLSVDDYVVVRQVIHPFDAQSQGELSLSVDDYVVVRQVAATGWSEGECKGQTGWFPSAYVEKLEQASASKIVGVGVGVGARTAAP